MNNENIDMIQLEKVQEENMWHLYTYSNKTKNFVANVFEEFVAHDLMECLYENCLKDPHGTFLVIRKTTIINTQNVVRVDISTSDKHNAILSCCFADGLKLKVCEDKQVDNLKFLKSIILGYKKNEKELVQ